MKVREVMTHGVVGVSPNAAIKEAVRLMERHVVSGLPVVDEDGDVVGVISEADLLLKELGRGGLARRRFGWLLGHTGRTSQAKADAITVAQAMTAPAITADPDDSVRSAARVMVERRVNRLPVVKDGHLVGIITRADVARVFVRSDADLAAEIEREVQRCTLGSEESDVHVYVREGVAGVEGSVDRRSTAEVLQSLIERIDGLVAADIRITWRHDDTRPPPADLEFVTAPWDRLR
jgi:CBS domain-containing protein